jgi:hypothetical protein
LWHIASPEVCDGTPQLAKADTSIPIRIRMSTDCLSLALTVTKPKNQPLMVSTLMARVRL